MKKGIAIGGNILIDKIKMIDVFPQKGMLCNIKNQSLCVGGCVCNTGIDLAKLSEGKIKLYAIGRVGNDYDGGYIIKTLEENGIDTAQIIRQKGVNTSYTDVMTEINGGQRTFFHYRGTNDEFCYEDINFDKLDCDILHLGYALLLDKFDKKNEQYGTELAKALYKAQQKGIKTSLDVVSEQSGRFKEIVSCSLKYCDYITLNEIESQSVSGVLLRDNNNIIESNLKIACEFFIEQGVKQVCIHFPEGCAAMNGSGEYRQMPSLDLPQGYIKGTVGAGDAFCAGILYAAYNQMSLKDSLILATCSASSNLSQSDSISGMKGYTKTLEIYKKYSLKRELEVI